MVEKQLRDLLSGIKEGLVSVDTALERLKQLPFEDLGYAKVDHHRGIRTGYPEVIFAQGKTSEQVIGITRVMAKRGSNVLITRISPEMANEVLKVFPEARHEALARVIVLTAYAVPQSKAKVLVCTGGTSDLPVAEEAAITAEVLGCHVERLYDVGVAGIHRLLSFQGKIDEASVIIAVAGMEGALASVVGGLTDKPVIAVPTSVGYGAHFGGLATLLAMLNSCASGIGVVNIDNGFGAGYLASSIIRQIEKGRVYE